MSALSEQMENWDRDNHPSDCESYVPSVRELERQIAELTAEKQRADRLDAEGDRLAKDWVQATAALIVKTLEWEGERDRLVAERDQLREAVAWAYQFAGAAGATAEALDNLSALSNGSKPPHPWPYPAMPTGSAEDPLAGVVTVADQSRPELGKWGERNHGQVDDVCEVCNTPRRAHGSAHPFVEHLDLWRRYQR